MRNDVNEWRHKINMSGARPPLWFELLQQERENCQLQDDDQTTEKLKHLTKYNDLKYSPCIHAKLCLLVYSLPLYELCALHMLDAVKFFVCHILELPEGCHNEWLEERKLLRRI
ncbi:uncharacterized protein LOC130657716 [Hydractinia symbiolongicarpus]|uniref:uncharacterized protein LOC130657716 n=1 Tax=Hydractinia symbiolongicarpus TaxID=13093 RepID=UPI00254BD69E|nr:uncharacterized protein LOC130657716 [Hydractinia symbiolongicarpus]